MSSRSRIQRHAGPASQLQRRPAVAPSREWTFPAADAWHTGSGITGLHVPVPGCGLIDYTFHLDAPLAGEPEGRQGLTDLVARCLAEGASADRDAADFAAAMDEIGATFDAEVTAGGLQLKVGAPAAGAATAVDLVAGLLRAPRFDQATVRRMVANNLDEHGEMTADAAQRARAELYATAFEAHSRISLPHAGTPATVSDIGHELVADYWAAIAAPRRVRVVSAGDLSSDSIRARVASAFDGWSPAVGEVAAVPGPSRARPRARLVDRPGAVQTAIAVGAPTVGRQHDHFALLRVATYVLGVPINSRLSHRLREVKGYTYGVRAAIEPDIGTGLFTVATQVERDVTVPALADTLEILQSFRDGGMSSEEHSTAVDGLLGKDPIAFQTPQQLVRQLSEQEAYRLPVDWYTELRRQVAASSPQRCHEAFVEHVDADLSLVLVGDAESIEPRLRDGGWSVEVSS